MVGPAVERKIGNSAFSAMTINATKWYDADWARQKGLYTEVFDSTDEMDKEVNKLKNFIKIESRINDEIKKNNLAGN